MHSDLQTGFAWEVKLPGKGTNSSSWGAKPRATLVIWPDTTDEEQLAIPVQVARTLARKKKTGEIEPKSRAELLYLLDDASMSAARLRIERLINRREYSSEDIRTKLRQDGFTQKTVNSCVERACEVGLISDERYASAYIRSKILCGWGIRRIERELAHKGIEIDSIDGWPEEYFDSQDELSRAMDVVRSRRVEGRHAYECLVRHLCGKGYPTGIAMQAVRKVLEERSDA